MISDRISDDIPPQLNIMNTVIPVRAVVSYLGDNRLILYSKFPVVEVFRWIYGRKFSFTVMCEQSCKT